MKQTLLSFLLGGAILTSVAFAQEKKLVVRLQVQMVREYRVLLL
ncbi:hypothetical protein [Sphingobacterium sp. IITKGP-BTPF85]|nr:hypothetical protein [Sphingobacterium sp. IITKGP-BTPF85]KKX47848.1 hypothetical protein L950_0224245 [Sphingobacterium sp. IITKGP-BTPF85]